MNDKITEALRSIEVLAALPPELLGQLAEFSSLRSVRAGELVFNQGEESPYCFGVVEGEITIQRISREKDFPPKTLSVLGRGALFGESALFADTRRSALAVASRESRLVAILGPQFRDWLKKDPAVGVPLLLGLLQNTLGHLRQTSCELAVIHGVGRLLGSPKPYKESLPEAVHFLQTSLDAVDEVVLYQRSPYWEEFEPVACLPATRQPLTLPVSSPLVEQARYAPGPLVLRAPEQQRAVLEADPNWQHHAAVALVPLVDKEDEASPLQGFFLLGSLTNFDAFPPSMLLMLTAVSGFFAEAMGRGRRQEDSQARSRLSQARQSYTL